MKKFFRVIILLIMIIACSTKDQKIPYHKKIFPNKVNSKSIIVISLDTINNFKKINDLFCKNINNRKLKCFIRTAYADVPFFINDMILCGKAICGMIKRRNTIFINNLADTIFKHNEKFHEFNTDKLCFVLEKQFLNNGKNSFYADNPKRNIIIMNIDSLEQTSHKKLTNNKLDTIVKAYVKFLKSFEKKNFDSLKKEFPLYIRLDKPMPLPPYPSK